VRRPGSAGPVALSGQRVNLTTAHRSRKHGHARGGSG